MQVIKNLLSAVKEKSMKVVDLLVNGDVFEVDVPQPASVMMASELEKQEPSPQYRTYEKDIIGTNYDPYDPHQTKPNPDGLGKALIKLDENMVATALSEDGETGNFRLGTVIQVPELGNRVFLVADTMNKRFNGMPKIDFVDPGSGANPNPDLNRNFSGVKIIREGNGPADARQFVESGEWAKLLEQYNNQNNATTTP